LQTNASLAAIEHRPRIPREADKRVNRSEPIFNVPGVVLATLAVLAAVHIVRAYFLTPDADLEFLLRFSFIPARYDDGVLGESLPGGLGADLWTFVTYALIHADATHLIVNAVWLLAFGTPLARRFGAARFIAFLCVTAAAGAGAHLLAHRNELIPVVGASAAVSGAMAAAMRFAFQSGGPLGPWRRDSEASYRVPAASLARSLRNPAVLVFLVVWIGLNLLFGLGTIPLTSTGQAVAWQAHIGGFAAGLLLFALFDPVKTQKF
jgi:membrane associated rhomboid family serine protease